MSAIFLIVDFLLFCLTLFVMSKKATVKKTLLMIAIVSVVHILQYVIYAQSAGLSVYDYIVNSYNDVMSQVQTSISSAQAEQTTAVIQVIAMCWVAINVMQAAWYVSIALALEWAAKKVAKKKNEWTAFTSIDLPIWTVFPLIVGILLLIISWIPQIPYGDAVFAVSINVLIISTLPLYAQGGAAIKGLLNKANISLGIQIALLICSIFVGLAFFITPLFGLIDYWANFRKLPRDASDAK